MMLRMLAANRGVVVGDVDREELTNRFASMPPHPEVPAALQRLRDPGFRLFTLADNTRIQDPIFGSRVLVARK